MKRIGIVAVTTVGACICANEIIAEAARHDSSGAHPEFAMHAFSFHLYKELVIKKDWVGLANLMLEAINKLKLMNMDFIIIPSNTPHYGFDVIEKLSPLPVLNLIEITAAECSKKGYKKVGVLGTKSTMLGGLYESHLKSRGITPIIPDEKSCDRINDLIMNEIIPLKPTRQSVANAIAEEVIKKMDCDAFILGCTELPDVYNDLSLGKPAVDTTRLLAHHALSYAMTPQPASKITSKL